MTSPKVCIIIPTRERADTLFFTIMTCIQQQYDNLEILVSDNFSQDNTPEVIASFSDKRIRYINPGTRLSMTDHWEYALAQVDADFVTVLGDDDAMLPNAIQNLVNLIDRYHYLIITWKKVEYGWPNHIDLKSRGVISIPLRNQLISIRSSLALKNIFDFRWAYNSGPCIYNSLVSMECINQIKKRDGKIFQAVSPDIYSSLALSSVTDSYLFSTFPFSINGASAHSNGTSFARPDLTSDAFRLFQNEYHFNEDNFSLISGSVTAAIVDAVTNFKAHAKTQLPQVDYKRAFNKILKELANRSGAFEKNRAILGRLADKYGVKQYFDKTILGVGKSPIPSQNNSTIGTVNILSEDRLTLLGDRFDVYDVSKAASFIGNILGDYSPPQRLIKYSWLAKICTRLANKIITRRYYLGI